MRRILLEGLVLALTLTCLPLFTALAGPKEPQAETPPKETAARRVPKPLATYRVEFTVRELEEGKRVNARNYVLLMAQNNLASIRVGSRVPFTLKESEVQYEDVGMDIDCNIFERENGLLVATAVESSAVLAAEQVSGASQNPVFRQAKMRLSSVVQPGKPTVIGVMDDVLSARRFEIEVTATKVR